MTVTLGDLLGQQLEEEFSNFDLTEIQDVLSNLRDLSAIDLAHAELFQQQTLRGADMIAEYLGKMVKTVSYLESKVSSLKNKAALDYVAPNGKSTMDLKKMAGETSPEVTVLGESLAKAKGAKSILEKKYDILIKSHHHYKDISAGLRKTILGYSVPSNNELNKPAEGWE